MDSISEDGRYVAFASKAPGLVAEDADEISDIFVRDTITNRTILVSRAEGLAGNKGNSNSTDPGISPDGRFVAFVSNSTNLVPGPARPDAAVFVRDLLAGTTELVNRASGVDGEPGNSAAFDPGISADGSRVVFASEATNLDPATSDVQRDVYLRDLATETTSLVSRGSGPNGEAGIADSDSPQISDDGSRVAFHSVSQNLAPDQPISLKQGGVFVRDLTADKTILASRKAGRNGSIAHGTSSFSFSGNGNRVAFLTTAHGLHPKDPGDDYDIYVRDLKSDKTIWVTRSIPDWGKKRPIGPFEPTIDGDGDRIGFTEYYQHPTHGRDSGACAVVRDLGKGKTRLVAGAESNRGPTLDLEPRLSGDGRWLAFQSENDQLVPGDPDNFADVFVTRAN